MSAIPLMLAVVYLIGGCYYLFYALSGHPAAFLLVAFYSGMIFVLTPVGGWVIRLFIVRRDSWEFPDPNDESSTSPSQHRWWHRSSSQFQRWLPWNRSPRGPLLGYRAWHLRLVPEYGGLAVRPQLTSLASFLTCWWPGVNDALCLFMSHRAPAPGCHCGFWMKSSFRALTRYLWVNADLGDPAVVQGAVLAWGRCIQHRNGWRCEKAMVIALLDNGRPSLSKIARQYEVPIFKTKKELVCYAKQQAKQAAQPLVGPSK